MSKMRLSDLKKGDQAYIVDLVGSGIERFLKMGMLEGSHLTVLHEAPFGKDPMAVKIRDSIIAIRRQDADSILVKVVA
jgi:ferrous iron transport protein A